MIVPSFIIVVLAAMFAFVVICAVSVIRRSQSRSRGFRGEMPPLGTEQYYDYANGFDDNSDPARHGGHHGGGHGGHHGGHHGGGHHGAAVDSGHHGGGHGGHHHTSHDTGGGSFSGGGDFGGGHHHG
jgi:hypothetical protein